MSAARVGDALRARAWAGLGGVSFSARRALHQRGVDGCCISGCGLGSCDGARGYALDAPVYMAGGGCLWFDSGGVGLAGAVGVWVRRGVA